MHTKKYVDTLNASALTKKNFHLNSSPTVNGCCWTNTFGQYKRKFIINLFQTSITLRNAIFIVNRTTYKNFRSKVLFVNTDLACKDMYMSFLLQVKEYIIHTKWRAGTLSNFKKSCAQIRYYFTLPGPTKEKELLAGVKKMQRLPSVVINNSTRFFNSNISNETRVIKIPLISNLNLSSSKKKTDYPIITNTEILNINLWLLQVYKTSLISGYKKKIVNWQKRLQRNRIYTTHRSVRRKPRNRFR